jgi:hypothetical protein
VIEKKNMEIKGMNLIVEKVKIDKMVLWRHTFVRDGCNYFRNVIIIIKRIRNSLFVFIITARTQR